MHILKFIISSVLILISTLSFSQDVTLSSQADVDAFDSSTTVINGDLYIGEVFNINSNIIDLSNLANITEVYGKLSIRNNFDLTSLNNLSNLTLVHGALHIESNYSLANLDGLSNLTSVGLSADPAIIDRYITIDFNLILSNIDGLLGIETIGEYLSIQNNYVLENINGLSNLNSISGSIFISGNDLVEDLDVLSNLTSVTGLEIDGNESLFNIDGLSNITTIDDFLMISFNQSLTNLDALSNLNSVGNLFLQENSVLTNLDGLSNLNVINGDLLISNNPALSQCCEIQLLLLNQSTINGSITINDNQIGCNSQNEILGQDCGNIVNFVEGNVFLDNNSDCLLDEGDISYPKVIVQAINNDYTNTTVTDSLGNYKIFMSTGQYEIRPFMPNSYTDLCTEFYTAEFLEPTHDSLYFDFPTIPNAFCPQLEVDLSTWTLRECFDNSYYVQYCNSGTIEASDAYIELALDEAMTIESSSVPFTGPDINNIYTFQLGTIAIGSCESFNLNIVLPCDTLNTGAFFGQTLCVDAHIYPDSICLPSPQIWDGSSIQLVGECDQDSIRFRVRNIGLGDMLTGKTLYVFEDQVLFTQDPFQLNIGEEIELAYFANGSTFRLEAEQSDGHPGNSNPSVDIEGCTDEPIFSLGFVNQFSQDDGDVFVSTECREVTGSYDPNDKQAFPTGYGEEHFIEKNTDIEYLIRFQNTGTDTAFTVVIQDKISPLFDITTIQPGASSHPYTFEIDTVIRFVFNDILLVDSFTNEAASHGFVKFRIAQQADLPNGTLLENTAEIYFDFNAPIITNTTFHTVGENFVTVDLTLSATEVFQISSIKAYPNPFSEVIHFELEGNVFEEIVLSVFDVNGRQVASQNHNSPTFQFERGNLTSGVYFYTLSSEGMDIANGRMILN